jgi:3-oxoadipate enol-lactonase
MVSPSVTLMALAARTDTTAVLGKLTSPLLIIVGEQDALTPPSDSEAILAAAPGATLVLIPDAAHLSNLENPDNFNDALLGFLE